VTAVKPNVILLFHDLPLLFSSTPYGCIIGTRGAPLRLKPSRIQLGEGLILRRRV